MAGAKKIMTAAQIQALWKEEAKGEPWTPSDTITRLLGENNKLAIHKKREETERERLEAEVERLQVRLDRAKTSSACIREYLDETLAKHGIKAAFEPLIAMATERYPEDFSVEALQGEFKLDADQRIKIWTEILSYQMPKLKAMEVSGTIDNSISVIVRRFGDDTVIERDVPVRKIVDAVEVKPSAVKGPGVDIKRF